MTMRVIRLEAENSMKLVAVDIKFDKRVTALAGKNGAGKSSIGYAIKCVLQGKDAMPDDPIRHGTERAFLRTHLAGDEEGGLIATCRLRKDDDGKIHRDLTLETPEGARFPSPQTHLNKLISDHLLDPLEFIEKMNAKQQYDVLRAFVPGFDFDTNERMRKGASEKRTEIGRDRDKAQAAAAVIDVLDEAPGERVDETALTAELESAGNKNLEIERRRTNRENAAAEVARLRDATVRSLREANAAVDARVEAHKTTDADLCAQIEALMKQMTALEGRREANHKQLAEDIEAIKAKALEDEQAATTKADELRAKLDGAEPLPDVVDASAISAKLNEARRINRLIEDWEAQRARKQHQQREADKLSAEYDGLTAKIAEFDQAKKDAIQKATLPIDGLGFGDGFITFKDVPFKQASKGEQMRTAFALVVSKRPILRFCWIRDASLLDDEGLALVDQMAEEFDCQVLLEFVRPNSANAIIIEDGRVQGVELPPSNFAAPAAELELTSQDPAKPDSSKRPKKTARRWQGPGAPNGADA
jgi:hypothetical protein